MSINMNKRLSRSSGIVGSPGSRRVIVVGVGSIGSNVVHMLVSMGFTALTIIDFDVVMEENLYPAFFPGGVDILGLDKTQEIREWAQCMGVELCVFDGRIEDFEPDDHYDICIMAVDSLMARRVALNKLWDCCDWVIDGRMGGPLCTVITMPTTRRLLGRDIRRKYERVYIDVPSGDLPCGEKATAPLTKGWIPGMVGQSVADIINGDAPPYIQRYDLSTGIFIRVEMQTILDSIRKEIGDEQG